MSATVANEVVFSLLDRGNWENQGIVFCQDLIDEMNVWHVSSGPLSPPKTWPDEPPGDDEPREPPDLDPGADLGGGTVRLFIRWVNGEPEWGVQ